MGRGWGGEGRTGRAGGRPARARVPAAPGARAPPPHLGRVRVVGAADPLRVRLEQALDADRRLPVELDKRRLRVRDGVGVGGGVGLPARRAPPHAPHTLPPQTPHPSPHTHLAVPGQQGVGVHAEPLHVAVVEGDADVVEQEGEHVQGLWVVREKVGDAPPLLDVVDRVGLERVHHVRELHAVAHEEDGHVVADQVPVACKGGGGGGGGGARGHESGPARLGGRNRRARPGPPPPPLPLPPPTFARVELDRKPARVPNRLRRPALVDDGGEARDDGGLHARRAKQVGARQVRDVVGRLEKAFGGRAARVHDALGDALAVKLWGGRGRRHAARPSLSSSPPLSLPFARWPAFRRGGSPRAEWGLGGRAGGGASARAWAAARAATPTTLPPPSRPLPPPLFFSPRAPTVDELLLFHTGAPEFVVQCAESWCDDGRSWEGGEGVVRRVRGWEGGGGPSRRRGARQRGDGHARARASGAALPAPAPGAPVPTPGGDPGAGRVARAARRIRSRRVSSGAGAPKWRGGQRPPSLSLTHLGVHGGVLWGGWEAPAAERQRGSGATAANGGAHTRARRPPPRRPPSVIESGRGSAPARWRASKRGAARFCAAACRQDGGERPRQLLKRCADAHGAGRGSDWGGRGRAAPRARIRATAPPSPLARRPNHTRPARPAPHRLAR